MITRKVAASAIAAVVVGATLVATPASAASSYQPCPSGAFCFWEAAYRGGDIAFYRSNTLNSGTRVAASMARKASSVWNRTGRTVRMYANPDCTGSALTRFDVGAGEYVANLAGTGFNDATRSVRYSGSVQVPC